MGVPFSVRGPHRKLCEGQHAESQAIIRACSFIWRQKAPLKVQFFGWLLLRRRLPMRIFHKHLYLKTLSECTVCLGGEEDCANLFFECPFARMIWNWQTTMLVETTLDTSFWDSISMILSVGKPETDNHCPFLASNVGLLRGYCCCVVILQTWRSW